MIHRLQHATTQQSSFRLKDFESYIKAVSSNRKKIPLTLPQTYSQTVLRKHLENFISRDIERDLMENVSSCVRLESGTQVWKGHEGVRQFNFILDEYLPRAEFFLKDIEFFQNFMTFRWEAESSTASIREGKSLVLLQNNLIVREIIMCEVSPEVMNQG